LMTSVKRRWNILKLKGIKIKLYPTFEQANLIQINFDLNRFLFNQLLGMQKQRPKNSYKSNCVNWNIQVINNHTLKLPKLGIVKACGLKRIQGKIKSVVIHKESTVLIRQQFK
jgi:transposase